MYSIWIKLFINTQNVFRGSGSVLILWSRLSVLPWRSSERLGFPMEIPHWQCMRNSCVGSTFRRNNEVWPFCYQLSYHCVKPHPDRFFPRLFSQNKIYLLQFGFELIKKWLLTIQRDFNWWVICIIFKTGGNTRLKSECLTNNFSLLRKK